MHVGLLANDPCPYKVLIATKDKSSSFDLHLEPDQAAHPGDDIGHYMLSGDSLNRSGNLIVHFGSVPKLGCHTHSTDKTL